jgi:hypothetical protein
MGSRLGQLDEVGNDRVYVPWKAKGQRFLEVRGAGGLIWTHLGGCCNCGIDLAPYAEQPDDVVTEASPGSFHRRLPFLSTSKLPKSATLLYPGVRELCDRWR